VWAGAQTAFHATFRPTLKSSPDSMRPAPADIRPLRLRSIALRLRRWNRRLVGRGLQLHGRLRRGSCVGFGQNSSSIGPGCAGDFAYLPHAGRMSPRMAPLSALVASIAILLPTSSEARDAPHSSGMYQMSVEYPSQYRLRRTPFAATRG